MTDNSTHNNKLDSFIKDSLKDTEVPFDAGHWAEMEQRLDAVPKANPFKKWSFTLNVIVGAVIVGAGVFALATMKPDTNEPTTAIETSVAPKENPIQQVENNKANEVQETNAVTTTSTPEPALALIENEKNIPEKENSLVAAEEEKRSDKKEKKKKEKRNSSSEGEGATDFMSVFHDLQKNRVATFGDQIDPVHGFVNKTSEAERLQKEAQQKVTSDVPSLVKNDSVVKDKVFSDSSPFEKTAKDTTLLEE